MIRTILFLGVLGAVVPASAQSGCGLDARNRYSMPLPAIGAGAMSPQLAEELNRDFDLLSVQWRIADAERALKLTRTHAAAAHNVCAEGIATFGLGWAARLGHLPDALPLFHAAEELLRDGVGTPLAMAYVHQRIASTEHAVGNNPEFLRVDADVRRELRENGDAAGAIAEQSVAFQWGVETQKVEDQAQLFESLKTVEAPNVIGARAVVQWEWGSILRRKGFLSDGMEHFRAAEALLKQCDCLPATQGAVQLDMALAADSGGDADSSLAHALAGDRVYRKYHLDMSRPQAERLIGAGYVHRKDFRKAIATVEEGLKIAREYKIGALIPSLSELLASAYGETGEPLKGIKVLEEGKPASSSPSDACIHDGRLASLQSQANLTEDAASTGMRVMEKCNDVLSPLNYANIEWVLADKEMQLGRLEQALGHARAAVELVEQQRTRIEETDHNLIEFTDSQSDAYTVLINVLARLDRGEEALLASEQFRARAFVDLSKSRVMEAAKPGETPSQHSEAHPFSLTGDELRQTVAAQHATLLSYWLTNEGQLYTWVMAEGKPVVQIRQEISNQKLETMVHATLPEEGANTRGLHIRTRGGQSERMGSGGAKSWQDLYGLLIEPVVQYLPQEAGSLLTIVPQGPLFGLSFSALMDSRKRYLVEQYSIDMVPAASVLQITGQNDAAAGSFPARYLLVANPERYPLVNGRPLPALPGTAAEVKGISHELGVNAVTVLEGRRAGITTLMASLGQATTVHFATHAVVSDSAPQDSFLALDRSEEGGRLTTGSVYGLRLHAHLVVLSACGTGRGKITGDGVAGLSRAFLYAGAASMVTTLWDVVDEPTARLMPKFYAGMARGESRSAALREAQVGLIEDLRAHRVRVKTLDGSSVSLPENPAYWAAFSLSGQP